jgi:uncharacterized protein YgbK (DUF1537 family)
VEEDKVFAQLARAVRDGSRPLVVIDDDPTGTQTVYDTRVLLDWDAEDLEEALTSRASLFFLLTNSRSLPAGQAEWLNEQIGRQLVGTRADVPFVVVSRSDSTLRGHYPGELMALQNGLGQTFDGHLLLPAFFEGGRYTIGDVHWVATPDATAQTVVPASSTEFARDAVFGYTTAHLPSWIQEKSRGRWSAVQVQSVPLEVVREGAQAVCRRLLDVSGGVPVVVNAATYGDMATFVLGLLQAESRGKRFLYRSAASFVRLRAGLKARPLLTPKQIYAACPAPSGGASQGLVIIGSHVAASTAQLTALLDATGAGARLPLEPIEIDVPALLAGDVQSVGPLVEAALLSGTLPVLYSSRKLIVGEGDENLTIGGRVMDALLATIQAIETRPRFVVAKGGITSHEVARRGLGARRATALGQVLAGVPVWRLEPTRGSESAMRFPSLPYVVFPGNVGGPDALLRVVDLLSGAP